MKPIEIMPKIFLEGFDDKEDADVKWFNHLDWDNYRGMKNYELLYNGKLSDIPRELAKKCFDHGYDDLELIYTSIDESIEIACKQQFCLIYKENPLQQK